VLARTRASSPLSTVLRWFHSSMPASTPSSWWIASSGPRRSHVEITLSVTTVAISMMQSVIGHEPGHLQVDPDQVLVAAQMPGLPLIKAS
jgi:hypothetical protein